MAGLRDGGSVAGAGHFISRAVAALVHAPLPRKASRDENFSQRSDATSPALTLDALERDS